MSTPSTPPQGDVDPKAARPLADSAADSSSAGEPDLAGSAAAGSSAAEPDPVGSAAASSSAAEPAPEGLAADHTVQTESPVGTHAEHADLPPNAADVPPYDASQEDMAHEYVDYYVTNPVDLPPASPVTPAPQGQTPKAQAPDASTQGDVLAGGVSASDGDEGASATAASGPPLPPQPPTGTDTPTPDVPPAGQGDNAIVPSPAAPPAPSSTAGAGTASSGAKAMTLMDHLGELRTRLVRSAIVIALAFAATYSIADLIFAELMRPLLAALPPNSKLIFTALPEAFFVYLQVGFVAAIFLASPYIFYQIWGFIAPGLYEEEKKFAVPMALCSAFFFILGAAFCFLVVFPFSFTFFVGFATEDIIPMPSLSEYLSFALKMLIAFGLIFEMPLFTFFLARMGLVTAAAMRKVRRYAILAIFIVAAILTPPDVMSQVLMAIPMLLLYECSIFVAVAFGKKPKADSEADSNTNENSASTESTGGKTAPTSPAGTAAASTSSPAPAGPQG